jgi:hypothetical protein
MNASPRKRDTEMREQSPRALVAALIVSLLVFLSGSALATSIKPPANPAKTPKQELGDLLFADRNLENVNTSEMGNLGLTPAEVEDIVAFLNALTDGFTKPDVVKGPPTAK